MGLEGREHALKPCLPRLFNDRFSLLEKEAWTGRPPEVPSHLGQSDSAMFASN